MEISKRIENIKEFFLKFNVGDDGNAILVTKFPKRWTLPDTHFLDTQFGVKAGVADFGAIFATSVDNGLEKLFDAVDYTISFNHEAQERIALLTEKVNELKQLFTTESLENLKNLTFTFSKKKKPAAKSKQTVKENNITENVEPTAATVNADNDALMAAAEEMVSESNTEA